MKNLSIKEVIRHTKAATLKKILDKSKEPGTNMSDLHEFIYSELEKVGYLVLDGELEPY